MSIKLHRGPSTQYGTFGVLYKEDKPLCVTLERPWIDNQKGSSCIPKGKYNCSPHSSEKFKNVWQVNNVPEREGILIHCGNYMTDSTGCILVGESHSGTMITNSVKTLAMLKDVLPDSFSLEIS